MEFVSIRVPFLFVRFEILPEADKTEVKRR